MRKPLALVVALPLAASPLLALGPAAAASEVKEVKLENSIRRGFKQQAGKSVTVNCPSNITWAKGKIFFCKAKASRRYAVPGAGAARQRGRRQPAVEGRHVGDCPPSSGEVLTPHVSLLHQEVVNGV